MKLVRYLRDGVPRLGRVDELDHVHEEARDDGQQVADDQLPLDQLDLLPVVQRSATIICVGLNYVDHAEEAGIALPDTPLLFGKSSSSLLAHGRPIQLPTELTTQVDYEAELGVVIGRRCSRVSEREALDYVWGYTCVNEVSARDLQFAKGQWFQGKSLDTFCPVGPWLTTADEVPDPQALRIRAFVDGECRQDSDTANMIFSVAQLISYVAQTITLERGDLIATGTPAGVGYARQPQAFLTPGDRVDVEIDGLGTLSNPVMARDSTWSHPSQ